jgi:choline dehydrogenase-like flavoprotein
MLSPANCNTSYLAGASQGETLYSDALRIPNHSILDGFDICIIGAGAAGIAMATRLAGSSKNVLMLCNGTPSDAGQTPNPSQMALYEGTVGPFLKKVNPTFCTQSRLNMYGGTTNHFAYYAHPMDEVDLKPRPGYRDAHWPIDVEDFSRYYPEANSFGNYGPFSYNDIPFWSRALKGVPFSSKPGDGLQNLIWHAQSNQDIYQFQTQCGPMLEAAPNVNVLFNAHALTIHATEGKDHVVEINCAALDASGGTGSRFHVRAASYVLATGGIEPVRLLKLSGNLGDNAKGHLGRGFMVHPLIVNTATVKFPQVVDPAIRNFYTRTTVRLPGPQQSAGEPSHNADLEGSFNFDAWGVLAPKVDVLACERMGNFHAALLFTKGGDQLTISILWESVPNENSTITLDKTQTDSVFHQPVVHVDWNLLMEDKHTIQRAVERCRQFFVARGASFELETDLNCGPEHWTINPGAPNALWANEHHMGALRMSAYPEDGIVDRNMRVHTVDNLYVAGSGVYPTSGHPNPTLTIVALALRLADHLQSL